LVITEEIKFSTQGHTDIINLSSQIEELVSQAELTSGIACLFVPGTTGVLTTLEFEPGLVNDIKKYWEQIANSRAVYEHNARWGDGNGYAHVRAAAVGPSLVVPIVDGKLVLGTWQDIVFIDFDNRPRSRTIIVQMVGE